MPGKIKVKILAGRNLPVMDRSGDTTDAYVEIKFGNTTYKTDVCRKSLNPQWNSEWYRFEVDDAELQDEPLQVRLMDHDTYSANDAIGKVYVNLNPLLLPGSPLAVKNIWTLEATMNSSIGSQGGSVMTGWIPVFDTMHGIRGEVNIIVKVELFSDCNKFRQSSCGVQFFYSPNIPHGYHAQVIHGFVEELVVSDDPEYKWIDKIRTPRASNEARQTLFFKLSGEVQRKIGLKALDLGGNAVIGYVQNFDLEGESGIVARGIGTAVTLVKFQDISTIAPVENWNIEDLTGFGLQSKNPFNRSGSDDSLPLLLSHSPNLTPVSRSPTNIRSTTVSHRFPKAEKPSKSRRGNRVSEYRASSLRSRQMSLQGDDVGGIHGAPRKIRVSTLSLADDLISETSLRNMLALEDMRGESPGNPFSRGLKNFRYLHQNILPRRVARLKSKISDSLDDESEPESNNSSTWSLVGSESTRSSIVDLRHSMRKKKFTHKKNANDGMAAMLIRSVHCGFPLDSVREDRETPTPSPVNFLDDLNDSEDKTLRGEKMKRDLEYSGEIGIPTISSSETDTSTSDEEPSESSTNYNILEDSYCLVDPSSLDETNFRVAIGDAGGNLEPSTDSNIPDGYFSIVKAETMLDDDKIDSLPITRVECSGNLEIQLERVIASAELSELQNTIEELLMIGEDSMREPGNDDDDDDGQSSASQSDENIESSTDFHILDETFPLLEDDILNSDYHPGIESTELSTISNSRPTIVGVILKNVQNELERNQRAQFEPDNQTSGELSAFDRDSETIEIEASRENKLDSASEKVENSNISNDSVLANCNSNLSSESQRVESLPEMNQDATLIDKREGPASSIMLRACHSTSSTNYNFLDETWSPIEPNSQLDRTSDTLAEPDIFTVKSSEMEVYAEPDLLLITDETVEDSETRDDDAAEDEPKIKESLSSNSQSDGILESSTDYNILEDSSLLIETTLREVIESMKTPETPVEKTDEYSDKTTMNITEPESEENEGLQLKNSSSLGESSLKRIDKHSDECDNKVAPKFEERPSTLASSHFLETPPISPSAEERMFDYPSSGSPSPPVPDSSPNTRLKHLKFLPKQKGFDSTEDVGFVTSTPVETAIVAFADFALKTRDPESSLATSQSPDEEAQAGSGKSSVGDEISDRQICPLGIAIDRTTMANELRSSSATFNHSRLDKFDSQDLCPTLGATLQKDSSCRDPDISSPKRDKPRKKIERTDTVIYKGPAKEKYVLPANSRSSKPTRPANPIAIVVAPPPEEHATRLQVPIIRTTNVNVQSTFSPDEMKTQQRHFANIASREIPIDECAVGESLARKYRRHSMLELLKTIDAKMMTVHHTHHERRDSTRSRRKKRERVNASATPSPDSVHRTRIHKRRSRSRSPDRPHTHNKNPVSSLTKHSFPNPGSCKINNFFVADPHEDSPSCESCCENLVETEANRPIVARSNEPAEARSKVIMISPEGSRRHNDRSNDHKRPDSPTNAKVYSSVDCGPKVESEGCIAEPVDTTMHLLGPIDVDHPFIKSHSAGSLERLRERFIVTTKMTNNSNTIDDLCVPCSPIILRQPDEQQPSSPVNTAASALPATLGTKVAATNAPAGAKTNTAIPNMHRRSSDSDLSITPKGNSLAGSDRSMAGHLRPSTAIVRTMNQDTMEMLEYPFITMQQYPAGFIINIGGLVSARSVKLLERITNLEEPEGRDAWWTEIRMEVRSHARALACNVVLGYKEEISICDDVCVLNASGTAAVINLLNASQDQENVLLSRTIMTTSVESDRDKSQNLGNKSANSKSDKPEESSSVTGQQSQASVNLGKVKRTSESNEHEIPYLPGLMSACSLCHLPYSEASVPFRVDVTKCAICRRAKVPDVLFTTIELPENIPMTGRGVFLQATVCKCKRDLRGELNAKEISDCLPFLEYELHSLLLNKLKVKGMNAIFGLKVQVSVGERLVIGMAVGTAVYLTALPAPTVPKIASGNSWHNEEQLAEIQKSLIETVKKNREFYRLKPITELENGRSITTSDTDESDDDLPDLDLGIGTKDACVLEVDDVEDMDRINLLMDERTPDDFHVVNTQTIPGLEDLEIVRNLQMFTQISRAKIPAGQFASMPSKYFARMIQTVLFKLRRMVPCALCDMQFKVALPEQDEIQLSVVGMALGLGEPTRLGKYKRKLIPNSTSKDPVKKSDENDMIFSLDEDQADNTTSLQDSLINQSSTNISNSSPLTGLSAQKHRPRSPFRNKSHMQHRHKHVPLKERYGVDITPLSYLPGGKIERYLGNLNFFFIRESTSIRENGGLSGFTHSFVTEILAIVRAHITALGGNAMVAFFMTQCVLLHSPHKNQGQSLINVGGDVVTVSYYGDDKHQGNQNC